MTTTYATKPYDEMNADERQEAYLAWKQEDDARVAAAIAQTRNEALALAAEYGNSFEALSQAAWNQPISMRGNMQAEKLRFAASLIARADLLATSNRD